MKSDFEVRFAFRNSQPIPPVTMVERIHVGIVYHPVQVISLGHRYTENHVFFLGLERHEIERPTFFRKSNVKLVVLQLYRLVEPAN